VSESASKSRPFVSLVAICCLALAGATTVSQAGEWNGSIETREGVEYVLNSKTGLDEPLALTLKELWRIGGDTESEDEFFGVINQVATDHDGNVYVLDRQLSEVKVYSPDGAYLKTIGREGEGPGEFRQPLDMFFLPNGNLGVLQLAPGRIVTFGSDGEPAGDYPTPRSEGGGTPAFITGQVAGKYVALVISENRRREGAVDIDRSLILVDSKGVEHARLLTSTRPLRFVDFLFDETVWITFDNRWRAAPSGAIYAVDGFLDYEIIQWDSEGNRTRVIKKEYDHRERTKDQKKEMYDTFDALLQNQLPQYEIKVSDYDPDVSNIYPREDGSLWVLTSRGVRDCPDGSLGVFDVFDAAGHFVREVTLLGEGDPISDGFYFLGDRLYVVTDQLEANIASRGGRKGSAEAVDEEEPEPSAIICYTLGPASSIGETSARR
jgi:hypothetical protein